MPFNCRKAPRILDLTVKNLFLCIDDRNYTICEQSDLSPLTELNALLVCNVLALVIA